MCLFDIHGVGFSPGCASISSNFRLDSFTLAGVPVFNLPIGSFRLYSFFESGIEESSPTRPPFFDSEPVYMIPFRKVPVVKIVFLAKKSPLDVVTPITFLFLTIRSSTSASKMLILESFIIFCIAFLYRFLSHWTLSA